MAEEKKKLGRPRKGEVRDVKSKPRLEFVVHRQVLSATKAANEVYGIFTKLSTAEGWIAGRDVPQEYYVLPLTRIPKEEQ